MRATLLNIAESTPKCGEIKQTDCTQKWVQDVVIRQILTTLV